MAHGAKSPSGNAPLAVAPLELALELGLGLSGVLLLAEATGVAFAVGAVAGAAIGAGTLSGAAAGIGARAGVTSVLAVGCGAAVSFARSAGADTRASARAAIVHGPQLRILANLTKVIAASSFLAAIEVPRIPAFGVRIHVPSLVENQTPLRGEVFLGQRTIQATTKREQCNTPTKRNVRFFFPGSVDCAG
jgi:hypothetical protein